MSEPIQNFEFQAEPITAKDIEAFRLATRTQSDSGLPLTFPTRYRKAEFQWLDHMGVDMRNLLHTEQEYSYLVPLVAGDAPRVVTTREEVKERRGMLFVTLKTDLICGSVTKVTSFTYFVVRTPAPKAGNP